MLNDDIIDPALKASALSLPGFENINEALKEDKEKYEDKGENLGILSKLKKAIFG